MNRRKSSVRQPSNIQLNLYDAKDVDSPLTIASKTHAPNEPMYFLKPLSDEWWVIDGNRYSIPEKFFAFYQNYEEDQAALNKVWEKVEITAAASGSSFGRKKLNVLHTGWKLLIRKGIPAQKFRTIILKIFRKTANNVGSEYNSALEVAFRGAIPDTFKNVPLFTETKDLHSVLKTHFLSDQGLAAFKRIMWVFQKNTPRLSYSPMLPQIVGLLLVFLKEEEVYGVTKMILEESDGMLNLSEKEIQEKVSSLRWHVTFKKEEFIRSLEHLSAFCKQRSRSFGKLERHFKKIEFNYQELFEHWLRTLFLGFFPFQIALKIFGCYLNEGIKVYFKFSYALLRIFRDDILRHHDPSTMTQMLREKALNITPRQCEKLFGKAYARRLGTLLRKNTFNTKGTINVEEEAFECYLPGLSEPSVIIDSYHLEAIWEWLPDYAKRAKPELAYSTKKHGWSLHTLYSNTRNKYCLGMLLLIKANHILKFGAFLDCGFKMRKDANECVGSDDCFVFQLEPEEEKYPSTRKNRGHLLCDSEYLSIGHGGDGSAIYLCDDLGTGFSYRSETYNNRQFNLGVDKFDATFITDAVEVYFLLE